MRELLISYVDTTRRRARALHDRDLILYEIRFAMAGKQRPKPPPPPSILRGHDP